MDNYGDKYFELCVNEDFFTRGTNAQYRLCIGLADDIGKYKSPSDDYMSEIMQLAAMTYICSDFCRYSYDFVARKVLALFDVEYKY